MKNNKKKCYWCGKTNDLNVEHYPPRCIYPNSYIKSGQAGYLNNVPSCSDHNNKLSSSDWKAEIYIKHLAFQNNKMDKKEFFNTLKKSKRMQINFSCWLDNNEPIDVYYKNTNIFLKSGIGLTLDECDIFTEKISRALIYDEENIILKKMKYYDMNNRLYKKEIYFKYKEYFDIFKNVFEKSEIPWKNSTKMKNNYMKKIFNYNYYISEKYIFVKLNFYENSLILYSVFEK